MAIALPMIDAVLRSGERSERPRSLLSLVLLAVAFGMFYGAVMGAYGAPSPRPLQVLYSALKVPILLLVTFVIGLPSFFVVSTLLGLRDGFAESVRALVATQAGLTIVLASFAPFTALWYLSVDDYEGALLFNALMFGTASIAAQLLLRRLYRPLIERDRRHVVMLRVWIGIYAFIGVQMGWTLRPFIGHPRGRTTFFREGAWGNAYVEVFEIARRFALE